MIPSNSIASVVFPVSTWDPKSASESESFRYVDIGAIDQSTKAITSAHIVATKDAPSRARQIIHSGDVLVSTVRPNLNGVALVGIDLDGATASTGFCVLRPSAVLDSRYLFQWVRTTGFVQEMTRLATGQSYPAVSDRIVKASMIPLPPIAEQRQVAEVLDRADALRAKRREALVHFDELAQSVFLDMFGDPLAAASRFPRVPLAELGPLDRGISKHRPRNDPKLLGGGYPLIQTGDVARSGGYIEAYDATYSELGLAQSKMWPRGTLCITIAANIAKAGILEFDACFPDSVVGFTSDPDTTEFVRVWLSFLQEHLERAAPESAQKNINLAILRELQVLNPPGHIIAEFGERIRCIRGLRRLGVSHLKQSDALFESLQYRAFHGEL